MINDVNITGMTAATDKYLAIIQSLQREGLIDGIGLQAHAFEFTADVPSGISIPGHDWAPQPDMSVHKANLDRLASTGLPIMVTELDIDGIPRNGLPGLPGDEVQLADYRRIFPTFWEHPAVIGMTLWGWHQPNHWRNQYNDPIVLSAGDLKPAGYWLLNYVNAIAPVIRPGQRFALADGVANLVGTVEADDWASQIGRPNLRTFAWQITGGTGAEIFTIESTTGKIRVANPLLLLPGLTYSLEIRVSDGFHTSDEAEVTIVTAVNAVLGDLNGDGVADCKDLAIVKASFGKRPGQPGFDPRADVYTDGVVDIKDWTYINQILPVPRC
jgi:endo-1,4-beta-xylanase